jgi:hypothetical protein
MLKGDGKGKGLIFFYEFIMRGGGCGLEGGGGGRGLVFFVKLFFHY